MFTLAPYYNIGIPAIFVLIPYITSSWSLENIVREKSTRTYFRDCITSRCIHTSLYVYLYIFLCRNIKIQKEKKSAHNQRILAITFNARLWDFVRCIIHVHKYKMPRCKYPCSVSRAALIARFASFFSV